MCGVVKPLRAERGTVCGKWPTPPASRPQHPSPSAMRIP
jgi:hypothetical protein